MVAVVVDGISASGKSLLLRAIKRASDDIGPNFTKLYLTEHLTERFFERATPSPAEVHAHVARLLRLAASLQAIQSASPFSGNDKVVTIVIERLFLTLLSRELMLETFFDEYAEVFRDVGLKSILLIIPDAAIEGRLARSITERNQAWRDHIDRLGGMPGATAHFRSQQLRMLQANELLSKHMECEIIEVADVGMFSDVQWISQSLWPSTSLY